MPGLVIKPRARILHGHDWVYASDVLKAFGNPADGDVVSLKDGRVISVPLTWYPRLLEASPAARHNWQLSGAGYGIHWPELDEDLSTEGLLRGAPAPQRSVKA